MADAQRPLPDPPPSPVPEPVQPAIPGVQPQVAEAAHKLFASRPEAGNTVGLAVQFGGNPLLDRLTAEHLNKSLDLAANKEQHEFELKKLEADQKKADAERRHKQDGSNRWFDVFLIVVFVGLLVFVVVMFRDKPAVMTPALTGIAGIFAGFASGLGYGKYKQAKDA